MHEVIGRLVPAKSEAEESLSLLIAEASCLGRALEELGRRLQVEPERVVFEGQEASLKYSSGHRERPIYQLGNTSGEQLRKLTCDIRNTMDRVDDLGEQISPWESEGRIVAEDV
jgi:hypothetical protein